MKRDLTLLFLLSSLLWGFNFSHLFKKPNSRLKVICDENKEKIYLDDKFKTECSDGDEIFLVMYEGEHTLVVKTEPSKEHSYYYFETKFKIGDGVEKTIKVNTKKYYTKQFFIENAKKSLAYKFLYLENYPNDSFAQQIRKKLKGTWQKTFTKNVIPVKIIATNEENFIILGTFNIYNKNSKKYIVVNKIDKNGNLLWTKNFKSKNDLYAKAIYKTKNNNFIIIGEIKDLNNISTIYILKIDENGNKIWEKTIKTIFKADRNNPYSLKYSKQTKDENVLIIFETQQYHTKINKINVTNGKTIWSYDFYGEDPYDIKEIKDKDYLVINRYDILEINYNKPIYKKWRDGKSYLTYKVWEKSIKLESDFATSVLTKIITFFIINNNEFIQIIEPDKSYEIAKITKFDKDSKILWKKIIKVPELMDRDMWLFDEPKITSYTKVKDGILFSAGPGYDPYLFKIDNNGNVVWNSMLCINHTCKVNSILPIKDGVVVSGTKDDKLWVMKIDANLLNKLMEK